MEAGSGDRMRVAELMAALSLATDLGLGQPLQRQLAVCLVALELAERLGCSDLERSETYYVALVMHVGCTGAAAHFASWMWGDDIGFQRGAQQLGAMSEPSEDRRYFLTRYADDRSLPARARLIVPMLVTGSRRFELMAGNLCEGATVLARRLHMPDAVALAVGQMLERWDGRGLPGTAAGEEISRPLRVVRVAQDLVAIARARDLDAAIRALERRRGRGHDPAVVDAALADAGSLLRATDVPDAWERVIDAEPRPVALLSSAGLVMVARAFGEFADSRSTSCTVTRPASPSWRRPAPHQGYGTSTAGARHDGGGRRCSAGAAVPPALPLRRRVGRHTRRQDRRIGDGTGPRCALPTGERLDRRHASLVARSRAPDRSASRSRCGEPAITDGRSPLAPSTAPASSDPPKVCQGRLAMAREAARALAGPPPAP